ncbi:MAG: hypothetical protein UX66_C0026G0011 [Parcubacteria group bacterium GW2011_GWF2_46_8]|nr:MAG: hypothetical protein UX66_C0026G0011 [Parcubacteria group bacterium GW2011_GWF2_46_8]
MFSFITVKTEKLVPGGYALGFYEEHPVFLWNALPGEVVETAIDYKRKGCWYGTARRIIQKSPYRIAPCENHFLSCSPWQIIDYDQEIIEKKSVLKEITNGIIPESVTDPEIITGNPLGYRNKLEISFTDGTEALATMAFHVRHGAGYLPITKCLLANEPINTVLQQFQESLWKARIVSEQLKTLVIRSTRAENVTASLYVTHEDFPLPTDVVLNNRLTGYRVIYSDPKYSDTVESKILAEYGSPDLCETVLDKQFLFSDQCFFQINVPLFEIALRDIQTHIDTEHEMYDVFSGVGTIGLSVQAHKVTLIEQDPWGSGYARKNLSLHQNALSKIVEADATKYDAYRKNAIIVCDPPRSGLPPKMIQTMIKANPVRIIYLSCNPITQMRDIKLFSEGYIPVSLKAYNFFPRTPHLETLIVLDRIPA